MLRLFSTVLIAQFLLLPGSVNATDNAEYEERMQFANGLHSRKLHELAVAEFAGIIKAHPNGAKNDAAKFRMAESLRLLGRNDEAAVLYQQVIAEFRESEFRLRSAYRRARLYMGSGKYEAAKEHLKAVINAKPENDILAASSYYLGESYLNLDLPEKAETTFVFLIENCADSMFREFAFLKLGDIYRDRWHVAVEKKRKDADKIADAALKAYADAAACKETGRITAEALFQSAEICFARDNYDKSSALYQQLIREFPDDQRSHEASLQAAWAAYNAGFFAEALSLAGDGIKFADSDSKAEWLYLKANCERQLFMNDKAVETYALLIDSYPQSRFASSSRYERALAYYRDEDYESAITEAKLIRLVPEIKIDVYWFLAESFSALKRSPEAIQYYRKIVKDAPGTDLAREATYRLAHHLQRRGDFVEASRFYNAVVSGFPEHELVPRALFASGACLASANKHNEAVRDWGRLIKEWKKNTLVEESLYQKGISEIRLERTDDALASLKELMSRFPESRFVGDAHYWRGMLLKETEQFEDAEKELREAEKIITREELRRDASFNLGLVMQKNGKTEKAAELFQRLLDSPLKGKFPPALLEWLTKQHYEQKRFKKAAEAAELLAESAEENVWQQAAFCLMGRALFADNNIKGAEDAFRRSFAVNASTFYGAEALLRLGEILMKRDDIEEAMVYFKKAAKEASADDTNGIRVRAFFALGQCAEKNDDLQEASRYYMSVAILFDDDKLVPQALSRASDVFKKAGKIEKSEMALEELKKRYPEWTKQT